MLINGLIIGADNAGKFYPGYRHSIVVREGLIKVKVQLLFEISRRHGIQYRSVTIPSGIPLEDIPKFKEYCSNNMNRQRHWSSNPIESVKLLNFYRVRDSHTNKYKVIDSKDLPTNIFIV